MQAFLMHRMAYVFENGGWSVGLKGALAGLGADQAAWRSETGGNTIWQIVNHLAFWKEIGAERLTGAPMRAGRIANDETFGPQGAPTDEASWQAALARLQAAHEALTAAVAQLTDAALAEPPPGGSTPRGELIAGLIEHDAYHAGQIVTLRRMQGDRTQFLA